RAARLLALAAFLFPQPGAFGMAVLESGHLDSTADGTSISSNNEASLKSISYDRHAVRIKLDKEVAYRVFTLNSPPRVVVELPNTLHGPKPYEASVKDDVLKRIRSSQFKTSPEMVARIVFDLPRMVAFKTVREGDSIVLRFNAGKEVSESADASAREENLQGEAEESLSAAAQVRVGGKSGKRAPKDILSSLPKNPITIDFDDADIRDVIRVLAEMSGINMIYASDLRGFVTVHLDQVPFDEVFSTVLTMQGLVSQQIGNNILRILTPEGLNTDRARSVTTYRTFFLNYAKAADLGSHLAAVKISPTSRFTVDAPNNALVVTDTPEGLAAAERLISELDRKPAQVLIETKLVQLSLGKSLDLGIQWEYANSRPLSDRNPANRRIIGQRKTEAGSSPPAGKVGFVGTDATGADEVTTAVDSATRGTGVNLAGPTKAGITFGFINSSDLLTATLGALETENEAKTLTNPKIITTNNQNAKIQIGQKVPFLQTTVSPGGTATQSTVFADVGFIIDVTPTINEDNRIRLKVKPESSNVEGTTDAGPTINTTTAETEVILRDGDTIVIGGLVSENMVKSVSKVPLLGDLPVLGVFFRSLSDTKKRQELLVFITARIVPD
ncbi:MAG TPA: type IV pilus secretin PilQ, partial [Elusimicrobiota bacterium]|nr:type IV pilus secretin PilQ [Elusimicrobiota bacterium]